jgi:protein SCO1/2
MSRRALVLATAAAAIVAFAIAFVIAASRAPRAGLARTAPVPSASASASVLWQVPAFSFADQNGRTTTAGDLRGHVWIADFVFTSCTSVCPLITAKMVLLQRRLSNPNLRFVSFSVDPARDTPEALKRYAATFRGDEPRWTLLATDPKGLERLAASMFVIVEPGEKDIGHSKLFFLVDSSGGVRGIYESDRDDALEKLVRDATALAGTAPPAPVPPPAPDAGVRGAELYAALGCGACHTRPELAPPLEGLAGRRVQFTTGKELTADAEYVRESIVAPDEKLVAGYALRMPSYTSAFTPTELAALVEHVMSLKASAPKAAGKPSAEPSAAPPESTASAAPPESARDAGEPDASAAQPATLAVDPVCSMPVRVGETTPRAQHAGSTVYFCSEQCRERFVADPDRYVRAIR